MVACGWWLAGGDGWVENGGRGGVCYVILYYILLCCIVLYHIVLYKICHLRGLERDNCIVLAAVLFY